jgi:hypothetical protein
MATAIDGGDVRVFWYREDAGYNAAPNDTTEKNFGKDASLQTREINNNATRVYLPGSDTAVDIKQGQFEGSWAVEFALCNPWWLYFIYGPAGNPSGSDPYTYTYDGDPASGQLVEEYDMADGTTDRSTLGGCVAQRAEISEADDADYGTVLLEGFYADEETQEDVTATDQPNHAAFSPLDAADASVQLDGSEEVIMRNLTLILERPNMAPHTGFGSRKPIGYFTGNFAPSVEYTKLKVDSAPQQDVYGGSTSVQTDVDNLASFTFAYDQSSPSEENQLSFNATGTFPNTYGESGAGDPRQRVEENLGRLLSDVTVTATNSVSSAP